MRRTLMGLMASCGLALAFPASALAAAHAPTLPSLAGELLAGTPTISDFTCRGTQASFNFAVSGLATGPFPGTFSESGTVTLAAGPGPQFNGFHATFTIASQLGTVTGTKDVGEFMIHEVECQNPAAGIPFDQAELGASLVTYQATIRTAKGSVTQTGTSSVSINVLQAFGGTFDTFSEAFFGPSMPTTTEQCKDSGWQTFAVFANQGDCVSFVATKGKNAPGN